MAAPVVLKKLARSLGLFHPARNAFRMLSSDIRRQRAADMSLYGQFIGTGDLVFDIGANLGQKSEIFLALGGSVVALEPNPNCAPVLLKDFGRNPNFKLVSAAVGSEPGEATLIFANTISTASLRKDWHGLQYRDGELEQRLVSVTTLDKLIAEHGLPDFCKIDVEGFEVEVVKGLSRPIGLLSLEYHADAAQQILTCLEALAALAPIQINVIEMNAGSLAMADWCTLDVFRDWISRDDVPRAGDVFVRSETIH